MNNTKTNTPGYNCRLSIYFTTNAKGQRMAFRYSWSQLRAFRMSLLDAELFVMLEQADQIDGNPFPKVR